VLAVKRFALRPDRVLVAIAVRGEDEARGVLHAEPHGTEQDGVGGAGAGGVQAVEADPGVFTVQHGHPALGVGLLRLNNTKHKVKITIHPGRRRTRAQGSNTEF
jgi:hypothetical protein